MLNGPRPLHCMKKSEIEEQLKVAMGERWSIVNRRLYEMDNIPNARDLGGIRVADGRRIKRGRLFRSALLTYGSERDMALLRDELRIGCVVDLRTQYEISHLADRMLDDAEYVNMPIFDKDNNMWFEMAKFPGDESEKLRQFALTEIAKEMTRNMYIGFVADEFCQLQYAAFVEKLLDINGTQNVLWHCSQGKDRTGLVTAFLLFALGCDKQTVVNDFALTNYYYKDLVDRDLRKLYDAGGNREDASVVESMLGVRVDFFEAALDYIVRTYGSIDNYLHDILVITPEEQEYLRQIYLE